MGGEERLGIVAALKAAPDHMLSWEGLSGVPGWDDLPDDGARRHALRLLRAARIADHAGDYSWVRLRADYLERIRKKS